jgi:hypothetical protein
MEVAMLLHKMAMADGIPASQVGAGVLQYFSPCCWRAPALLFSAWQAGFVF